jgi:hypothetical protein
MDKEWPGMAENQPGKRAYRAADRVLAFLDGHQCLYPGVAKYKKMIRDGRKSLAIVIADVYHNYATDAASSECIGAGPSAEEGGKATHNMPADTPADAPLFTEASDGLAP